VQATSLDNNVAIAGDESGDVTGKTSLSVRALYGLRSLESSWRAHITYTWTKMNFVPSHGDPDVWMRMAFNQITKASYWEYLLVYVDDLLAIGLDPRDILNTFLKKLQLCAQGRWSTNSLSGSINWYLQSL
jgi:hypothetical protein